MERRSHTRQKMLLDARLVRPGLGSIPGTIRDICPAGAFVALDPAVMSRQDPIDVGESVQLQFSARYDGLVREFKLRARVAGTFNLGVGCEFFDPDPKALAALRQIADKATDESVALSGEADEGSVPRASVGAQAILPALQRRTSGFLSPRIESVFKKAEESLFISAREAKTNAEQNLYFDVIKELERLKEPVNRGFLQLIIDQVAALGARLPAMQEPQEEEEESAGTLSLVESGEFADWLTTKQIYSRAEPRLRDSVFKLNKRLSALANSPIDDDNNPIGLAGLCHTFHDAVQLATTPRLARRAVFEAFDECVIADLGPFLEEVNSYLESAGVLPGIQTPNPTVAKRKRPESRPEETRVPREGPRREPQPRSASAHGEPVTPSRERSAAPRGSAPAAPAIGMEELLDIPGGESRPAGPAAARAEASANPFVDVSSYGPAGFGAAAPATAAAAFENVSTLEAEELDEADMAPHPSVAGGAAFDAKSAVRGHVYSSPMDITLSAFNTAQALLGVRRALPSRGTDPEERSLPAYDAAQVKSAISLLHKQESGRPLPVSGGPDLKQRVLGALRSRHGYTDKKSIGEKEGNAIEMIGDLINSVIADELVSDAVKPYLRRLEVPLLDAVMRDPQFFASAEHPARQMVNQLTRLQAGAEVDGDPSLGPVIESTIEEVLAHGAEDPSVFARAAKGLEALVERQAKTREQHVREVVGQCERQQALVKARGGSPAPRDESELPEEWKQWLSRAKRLQVGDAVILDKDTAHPQRAALAWVDEDRETYVFVDGRGEKAATMSLQELAMHLRRGAADVVPESDLPAMDRGLYSMLKTMHEEVLHEATHDELTELANLKEFELQVGQSLAQAKRDSTQSVMYLMDVDRFHTINEICGRRAGDRLLKELGRVLRKTMGSEGVAARLEGDEFGVLLPDSSREHAFRVADKQRGAIEKFRAVWKGERMAISVSTGMVRISEESETTKSLFDAAALARDAAKRAGGNRIELYEPGAEGPAGRDDQIARIERILEHGEFILRCQKISPIQDSAAVKPHYEILLGVKDAEGKPVVTGEFIQAAELNAMIGKVDRRVVQTAFQWMADNKRRLARLGGFSVNLSAQSLSDDDILEFVLEQFATTKLPPGKVLFEVTEAATINSLSNAENFIRVLNEYGCRFLLDDFGSGHSSYSYLKHLPIDYVKIDGMFVKDIASNTNDRAMVKSINEIGHFMGKKTVAEFVESEGILDELREIGVDYAQGFAVEEPRLLSELLSA